MLIGQSRRPAGAGALLVFLLLACAWLAPSASAAPLPGSSYDSQDGNQLTNTSPAAFDWQDVGPQAFLSTNLDNQANDDCFSGGTETQPSSWTFANQPGGCGTTKADILGMWTHGEITPTQNFLHGAFVRRSAGGSSFFTFELNQKATTWVNGTGTTIPCRSTGDILIAYDLHGSSVDVEIYRWTGDGSGPASCPNGARGTFQSSNALNNGFINSATITNFLSPTAIAANLGKPSTDHTVPSGLFGEAQIEIGPVLQSMGVTGCFSFVSAYAHSRSSHSMSSTLVDYVPPVPAQVANCAVTGTVWSDLNNNGSRGSGEGGAAGRTAFVDLDNDGVLDAGEPSDATNSQGFYFIPTTLTAGSYKVRVVAPPNSACTSPASCSYTSTFTASGTNTVQNDFGIYFFTPPQNTWAPSTSGTVQEGSTLTADRGIWTGTTPINYAYQWLRCDAAGSNCASIAGATNQTYTLAPADLNKTIRVRVTGTNVMGTASAVSAQTGTVPPRPPVNSSPPVISGTAQETSTLSASTGTWTGTAPITFAYQWRRCDAAGANCTAIAGATGQTYTLLVADIGKTLRFRVTATNVTGTPVSADSFQTAPVTGRVPVNTAAPTTAGNAQEASTLTTSPGTWTGTAPIGFAYQWLRCNAGGSSCATIPGATGQSYALIPADIGSTIRIRVTATNVAGSTLAQSAPTAIIAARAPNNTGSPAISGTPQEGSTLTASPGTWGGTQPISFSYRWRRCAPPGINCVDIAGANSQTYGLVPDDVGSTIRVRVTATNASGTPVSEQSNQTAVIQGRGAANVTLPSISGIAQDGQTLTANPGTWQGTQPITFAFQWLRCDAAGNNCADIAGAVAQTYDVVPADVGGTIRVRVTATNIVGDSAARSNPTSLADAVVPVNTATPLIFGNPQEASTLTADPGHWIGTEPIDYAYRWERCDTAGANCADIGGATSKTYDLVPADIGSTIRVRVTASNLSFVDVDAESAETVEISGRSPMNSSLPSISGNLQEASTLSANPGAWSGTAPISYAYQWLRCEADGDDCVEIAGATNWTYDLVLADVGSTTSVRVTATNVAGMETERAASTALIAGRPPVNSAAPSISGTPQEASTLTADPGTWDGTAPIDLAYQWRRCDTAGGNCSDIPGATGQTYPLVPVDIGATIRIRITATNIVGTPVSADSAQTTQISGRAPVNTTNPAISGNTQENSTLSATNGAWTGTQPISLAFQWLRCDSAGANCAAIAGATSQTYHLVPADVGQRIRARVTATNVAGNATAQSNPSALITARQPANTAAPTIAGTTREGSSLTAAAGNWTGTQPINFAYQWLRCDYAGANCTDIGGATAQSYALLPVDIGSTIRIRVTASNAAPAPVIAQSAATSLIGGRIPVNTTAPSISGTPQEASTLSADAGAWTGTQPIDFAYQWLRCDNTGANCSDIDGATSQAYDLVPADVGSAIRVLVTASNVAGDVEAQSSAIAPADARAPVNAAAPMISGTPEEASTLTGDPGSWTGTQPIDLAYQWLRCDTAGANCSDIAGATALTYDLRPVDIGSAIRFRVIASNASGTPVSADSPETAAVGGRIPVSETTPTISGTPREASTLTADPGTWTGTQPIDISYQWLRCDTAGANCTEITGATGPTVDLSPADIGSSIRVRITATNVVGSTEAVSLETATIAPHVPVSTAVPTVSGNPEEGSTLTADPGTWQGTQPITFAFQWLRCDNGGAGCAEIQGATTTAYDLAPVDIGSTIRVRVTADNAAGTPVSAESAPTAPISGRVPANVTSPSVSGTPQEGSSLTADAGTWAGTQPIDLAFQWRRCDATGGSCTDISGATNQTYALVPADVGSSIRIGVIATNIAGTADQNSSATEVITARAPVNGGVPSISGNPKEGFSLTAAPGSWTGTQPITFAYQWLRCDAAGANCADISFANAQSYALVPTDIASTIRVRVTATNASGTPVQTQSASTGVITGRPPVNTQLPTIAGSPLEGNTLTATDGLWTGTAPLNITYQWLRCNASGNSCQAIAGATSQTYVVAPADADRALRVRIIATNVAGQVSVESGATATVGTRAPVNDLAPTVSGNPEEGSTLTADPGSWIGTEPIAFSYQWLRCDASGANCAPIGGASAQTYLLAPADIGRTIRIRVTGANVSGFPGQAQSGNTSQITGRPPVVTQVPAISGSAVEGSSLTADPGTWSGTQPINVAYQWLRCNPAGANCTTINGATGQTLALVPAHIGSTIALRVTATNMVGTAVAQAPATSAVASRPPVNSALPSISGNSREGSTLTADPGVWTGTQPINLTYQWLRCDPSGANCAPIGGATGQTYDVSPPDVALTIRVRVAATNAYGPPVSADSAETAQITGRAPANTALPTISGAATEGSTLSANGGTWTGTDPIGLSYQWLRCDTDGNSCADIPGETAQDYGVVAADSDGTLRVRVTAANVAGSASADSAATAPIGTRPPVNDAVPTISGNPEEASTLTADPGAWSGTAPIDFAYQWLRCDTAGASCAGIGGATSQTYDLVGADVDSTIRIRVTATNISGNPVSADSPETAQITGRLPVNGTAPSISGTPREGSTLTADPGSWTGTQPIDLAYQWLRCDTAGANCTDIGGATSQTYDLVPADLDSTLRVRVTASNVAGNTDADSPATGLVDARSPANVGAPPTIMGDPHEGATLTADPGAWTGTQPIDFTYQWLRCDAAGAGCAPIPGATDPDYDLTGDDVGRQIRVEVTATNAGGSVSQRSEALGPIGALPSINTVPPSFSGMLEVGQTLTGDPGEWSGAGPFTFTYRWLRCDAAGENCTPIPGADDRTYILKPADEDGMIRLQVTATNSGGSVDAGSAPQGPVTSPEQPGPPPEVCQRAPAPTAMSFSMPGVGVMRFRVAPTGDAISPSTPLVASSTKRFTQVGRLDSLLSAVVYRLDRRKVAVVRRAPYRLAMPPRLLSRGKRHVLTVTAITRTGDRSRVNVPFRTAPCVTQFIANYRANSSRGALRLRVDNKLPIQRVTFFTPRGLLPSPAANTNSGRLRVLFGSAGRSVFRLGFGRRSARLGTVLRAPGSPRVKIGLRRVTVTSLPASTGMLKLELVRRGSSVRILRGPATLYARVTTSAGTETLRMTIGPRSRR